MNQEILNKYDVAISYLEQDEDLAFEIYSNLQETLNIFIYTQHQQELVGKNGVKTLRKIFLEKTNSNVILFRDGWGQTKWTSTEEIAIIDFGLANLWEGGITLVNLDGSTTPDWFANSDIYLDYQKYSFEDLIKIIIEQAQKRKTEVKSISIVDQAKALETKLEQQQKTNDFLYSRKGVLTAQEEIKILFKKIGDHCKQITSNPNINIEFKMQNDQTYYIKTYKTDDKVGSIGFEVIVQWCPIFANTLRNSKLMVSKIDLGTMLTTEKPNRIEDFIFEFNISPSMKYNWRNTQNNTITSTDDLADEAVKMILEFLSS